MPSAATIAGLIQFGFGFTELVAMELPELAFWAVTAATHLRGGEQAPGRGGQR